jgi:hypothetical protein
MELSMTKPSIEQRLDIIEKRNKCVEADKAWETSWTRRLIIAGFTYLFVSAYLIYLGSPKPWLGSLVPVIGYLLSTLVLTKVRNIKLKKVE